MALAKRVTTREFLRGFKSYKDMLQVGRIDMIVIPVDNNRELNVTLRKQSSSGKALAEKIMAMKKPIHIKRDPHLFDDLFSRR